MLSLMYFSASARNSLLELQRTALSGSDGCVVMPELVKQLSVARCIPNETFGCMHRSAAWPDGAVWVYGSCRAVLRCGSLQPFTCGSWDARTQPPKPHDSPVLGCDCARRLEGDDRPRGLAAVVNVSKGDVRGQPRQPMHLRRLPAEQQTDARWPVCLIMTIFVTPKRVAAYSRNALAWAAAIATLPGASRLFVVRTGGSRLPLSSGVGVRQLSYKQTRCAGKHGNRSGFRLERTWTPGEYCVGDGQADGEAGAIKVALSDAEAMQCAFFLKAPGITLYTDYYPLLYYANTILLHRYADTPLQIYYLQGDEKVLRTVHTVLRNYEHTLLYVPR